MTELTLENLDIITDELLAGDELAEVSYEHARDIALLLIKLENTDIFDLAGA